VKNEPKLKGISKGAGKCFPRKRGQGKRVSQKISKNELDPNDYKIPRRVPAKWTEGGMGECSQSRHSVRQKNKAQLVLGRIPHEKISTHAVQGCCKVGAPGRISSMKGMLPNLSKIQQ
jgi:hypothetical protein